MVLVFTAFFENQSGDTLLNVDVDSRDGILKAELGL